MDALSAKLAMAVARMEGDDETAEQISALMGASFEGQSLPAGTLGSGARDVAELIEEALQGAAEGARPRVLVFDGSTQDPQSIVKALEELGVIEASGEAAHELEAALANGESVEMCFEPGGAELEGEGDGDGFEMEELEEAFVDSGRRQSQRLLH